MLNDRIEFSGNAGRAAKETGERSRAMSEWTPTQADLDALAEFAGLTKTMYPFEYAHVKAGPLTEPVECYCKDGAVICTVDNWLPYKNPAHADRVLRALAEKKTHLVIGFCSLGGVEVMVSGEHIAPWWPEAVCKAALETKGGE